MVCVIFLYIIFEMVWIFNGFINVGGKIRVMDIKCFVY